MDEELGPEFHPDVLKDKTLAREMLLRMLETELLDPVDNPERKQRVDAMLREASVPASLLSDYVRTAFEWLFRREAALEQEGMDLLQSIAVQYHTQNASRVNLRRLDRRFIVYSQKVFKAALRFTAAHYFAAE